MRSNTRRLSVLVAVLITITRPLQSADPPLDSPEQKVLDQWVGKWQATYKVPKAEWTPEEKTGTAALTTTRVVGDRFVQEKSEHSDKSSGSLILTYDAQKKRYRGWWFSSAGHANESTGEWDDRTRTMTWTSEEGSITTTTTHRVVDADNTEWAVLAKDRDGRILFRMEGHNVRIKEPQK